MVCFISFVCRSFPNLSGGVSFFPDSQFAPFVPLLANGLIWHTRLRSKTRAKAVGAPRSSNLSDWFAFLALLVLTRISAYRFVLFLQEEFEKEGWGRIGKKVISIGQYAASSFSFRFGSSLCHHLNDCTPLFRVLQVYQPRQPRSWAWLKVLLLLVV
jgi:hypothetical protein